MERQVNKKNVVESPEMDEVQKTFLEKLKERTSTAKNKDNSKLKKFNYDIKRSKNETQNPFTSNTTDERLNQKTFHKKLNASFSFITGKKKHKNNYLKTANTDDERDNLTDEVQKTFLEKMKSFFCFCTAEKDKNNSRLNKLNHTIKRPKNEIQKQDKSFRIYIKRNCKWVIFLLVIYIIIVGAVVTKPILFNHFRVEASLNETEKERSIT